MLLNENTYYVHIAESTAGETDKKATPYIKLKLDVTHEASGGEWVTLPQPQTRYIYIYMSTEAWPNSLLKLQSLKYNGDPEHPTFGVKDFDAVCTHEEYQGKTRERWELASWGGREQKPISRQTATRLRALWKNANPTAPAHGAPAKPTRPAAPPASEPNPPEEAPPIDESDIPFDRNEGM